MYKRTFSSRSVGHIPFFCFLLELIYQLLWLLFNCILLNSPASTCVISEGAASEHALRTASFCKKNIYQTPCLPDILQKKKKELNYSKISFKDIRLLSCSKQMIFQSNQIRLLIAGQEDQNLPSNIIGLQRLVRPLSLD